LVAALSGGLLSGKYHAKGEAEGRYSIDMMKSFRPAGERQDRIVAVGKQIGQ
jgi:hypothetical protein